MRGSVVIKDREIFLYNITGTDDSSEINSYTGT